MGLDEEEARQLRPNEIDDALAAACFFLHGAGTKDVAGTRDSGLGTRTRSDMDELIPVVEELSVQVFFDESEDALEESIERLLIRPDRCDSDL
jgi:hypothetical protein